jgi:hypothetical protein
VGEEDLPGSEMIDEGATGTGTLGRQCVYHGLHIYDSVKLFVIPTSAVILIFTTLDQ